MRLGLGRFEAGRLRPDGRATRHGKSSLCRSRIGPILLFCACTALSGCDFGILDPQGPIGGAENTILIDALAIMLAIVVPTILATLAVAWWFRASNTRARYLPHWAYSGRIELVVWSIPLLVIMFLGGIAWIGAHRLDPAAQIDSDVKPLQVQVVSLDWKWLFIYPEQQVASVNRVVIPAGVPVHFSLTSGSVMNAFFVPQLGSMIATMTGMSTELNLRADRPGDFFGLSTQFSGDGFSEMLFDVQAVSAEAFADWTRGAQGEGQVLNDAAYNELTKQSTAVQPFTYRAVEPELYHRILLQKLPPGPGPATGRSGPSVSPRGQG